MPKLIQLLDNLTGRPNAMRELAGEAKEEFGEFVLASDAFFPFTNAIEEAHAAGIRYIVQPGGSKRDEDIIAACNRLGIAMIFTGTRHFKH